ncbi:FKBP-type peptidyl-prolyl cis-trans isomerase [Hymenobacter gelipurpurascens]|uniref:peptidylprolyl isomerase n=1 Tax=Hymenobacter gelipurpurascens TaxID=89968 RepID=A0A212TRQ3_9BACT|nr:FKBP-type peptidyl-prolyl cis-trans isomerase [Hymenobacter gelipurpurascens]SNC68551.1 FKBP-type peptidyl-prolyl cis-trans isomerase [Hymenobacter gelipurpurascens]
MFPLLRIRASWPALLGVAALMSFQGDPASFNKLKSGVEYRIFHLENGRYVRRPVLPPTGDPTYASRIGQIMSLHLEFRSAKDSVLMNSRKQSAGQPARVPLDTVRSVQRGGLEEAVALLQPGDSAVFRFNVDTIFAKSFGQPAPPFLRKAGKTFTVLAKVDKIQTKEAAMQEVQEMMRLEQEKEKQQSAQQLVKEDAQIQAYLKQNKLKALKTPGGVYYAITKASKGVKPTAGQTVAVLYKGMLLDGKVFDSSEKNGGKPIEFPLGQGRVIPGWDQGIAMLNKGSKAVLLIPSSLAYGARGAGADIPPNAILRFDVELVDVK